MQAFRRPTIVIVRTLKPSANSMPLLTSERLKRFIPFDELSHAARCGLLPHFACHAVAAGKVLFKRGEQASKSYFLLAGQVDLVDGQRKVMHLDGKDDTNLVALDGTHRVHRVSAISTTKCLVANIPRRHLELIKTWTEVFQSHVSPRRRNGAGIGTTPNDQSQVDDSDWLEALLTSELFTHIPPANIQQLLLRFDERQVSLGDIIIREGDLAEECYVLKEGKALVTRSTTAGYETLAALQNGALFGEDGLLSQLPRSASVTMSSDGTLLALSKADFDSLMKSPVLEYLPESQLDDLMESSDRGLVVLDVRTEQEFEASPCVRSRNIPLGQLRNRLAELSEDFIYIIHGEDRAEAAAYILSEAGLDVRILQPDSLQKNPDK